jgi:hypothetical protein
MGEKKNLDNHECQTENKKRDYFPTSETGKIMTEEKEREADGDRIEIVQVVAGG